MQDKKLPCVKLLVNVPAGNCRLIREEKLNLPATDGEGQGQDDMANICELLINVVKDNKPKLLIGLNQKVYG